MTSQDDVTTRFLRLPEVMHFIGLSRSQIYKMIEQGTFPPPILLSQRAVAWLERDIHQWMACRAQRLKKAA